MSLPITAVGPLKVLTKPILTAFCCAKTVPAGSARSPARAPAPAPAASVSRKDPRFIVVPPLVLPGRQPPPVVAISAPARAEPLLELRQQLKFSLSMGY